MKLRWLELQKRYFENNCHQYQHFFQLMRSNWLRWSKKRRLLISTCLFLCFLDLIGGHLNWPVSVCPFLPSFVCYQVFSGLAHLFFLIFCMKVQNFNTQNVTDPDFMNEKYFFGPIWAKKCPKIVVWTL